MIAEGIKEITLALEIILPSLAIDGHQLIDIGVGNFESFAAQARCLGHITDGRLIGLAAALAALHNPTQHPQVFAKTGPQKTAALVALEPVDAEDLRWVGGPLGHCQPMAPIVTHVVAAERQHRHRIAPHYAYGAGG